MKSVGWVIQCDVESCLKVNDARLLARVEGPTMVLEALLNNEERISNQDPPIIGTDADLEVGFSAKAQSDGDTGYDDKSDRGGLDFIAMLRRGFLARPRHTSRLTKTRGRRDDNKKKENGN